MNLAKQKFYEKRGQILVKNLISRHFDAYYCPDKASALEKALELIPKGAVVSWGGALSAQEIGLLDVLKGEEYNALDRDKCVTQEEKAQLYKKAPLADVFITGANALSLDGQMVNIDGTGNRVAAIVYGPESVIVIAGMNKVEENLDAAMNRARTVAAPMNNQRLGFQTPCDVTATCSDCKSLACLCNQILITRHCRPVGRIKFIIVGEDLGF